MTLLYVTDAFAVYGGMERVLADKMNYLAEELGYNVILLTVNQGSHAVPFSLHHQVKHIDLGIGLHQQYAYRGIRRLIKHRALNKVLADKLQTVFSQIDVDIVICVKLDFVGVLNSVRGDVPLIIESHTLCKAEQMAGAGWLRQIHVWAFKRQVGKADVVVALTEGDAEDWRHYTPQVCIIPNMVHLNDENCSPRHSENAIIFVGRNDKQKDFDSLLQIWSVVYTQHQDWTLDIYGDSEIHAPGVRVFKPTADIMSHYRRSSVLILTSLYEPFGLVLPEAMSCGLPVVAFDCPYGPGEIITDGVDGFLIKNRDINAFAERVCQLIEQPELRARMGQAGTQSSQRYRADVIMPKWKALFEQFCRKE